MVSVLLLFESADVKSKAKALCFIQLAAISIKKIFPHFLCEETCQCCSLHWQNKKRKKLSFWCQSCRMLVALHRVSTEVTTPYLQALSQHGLHFSVAFGCLIMNWLLSLSAPQSQILSSRGKTRTPLVMGGSYFPYTPKKPTNISELLFMKHKSVILQWV